MHFPVFSRYFYSRLPSADRRAYQSLCASWYDYNRQTEILSAGQVNLSRVIEAIFKDIPEFFYIDRDNIKYCRSSNSLKVTVGFLYSPTACEGYKRQIFDRISIFSANVSRCTDKLDYIHFFLNDNTEYSFNFSNPDVYTIKGVFCSGLAVCEGYAKAFKLLCDFCSIKCIVVSGTALNTQGRREGHAWNIVRIGDCNYHIDATWDDSIGNTGRTSMYYKVSDSWIGRDHDWDHSYYPSCNGTGEIEREAVSVNSDRDLDYAVSSAVQKRKKSLTLLFPRNDYTGKFVLGKVEKSLKRVDRHGSVRSISVNSATNSAWFNVDFTY